ncbi:LysR family transcriptional regulator [Pelagibacterium halotolerans]|uniref:Transcriptional regulator, LysR family n=1 Tax=Pelagibacterium halotolerans (strain DSM 22347 / JCM 15775 / CGMCC 1.7692 / B2) TaxID=1082931 RepID=G4R8D9_PELHB|nr:LysR family transcriptional regulator [Pelagibacterium halotolerans]AEQ52383.1 transcriptional regulator, LysR family [Pelagibacterium halotolerans B2]QJR17882.1 LysR family transcriptional regulator [Pelagibacterium halotolerans]SEA34876.1 LysR family transcriptional regulator, nitrogen assimilation regulatory protein [Pelagibacterium halotolerans]
MDTKSLRYFVQVVRSKSFSKAATELRIAQPAISRQVQKLEHELGTQLLHRHGKGVELTKAGFMLMERAEAVLSLLEQTRDHIAGGNELAVGNVVLGLPPMAGAQLAPPIVEYYRRTWPQIALHLLEGGSNSLHEWILDRRIDLAVLHNPVPLDDLDIEPILYENTVLVGPGRKAHGSLPRIGASISVGEMSDLPLIMPALPHANRRLLENAAAQFGVHLNFKTEVDSIGLIKAMIRYGLGFTVATYSSVQKDVALGEMQAYPIDKPPLVSTLAIVRRREMRGSWLTNELAATVRRTLSDLIGAGEWKGGQMHRHGDVE